MTERITTQISRSKTIWAVSLLLAVSVLIGTGAVAFDAARQTLDRLTALERQSAEAAATISELRADLVAKSASIDQARDDLALTQALQVDQGKRIDTVRDFVEITNSATYHLGQSLAALSPQVRDGTERLNSLTDYAANTNSALYRLGQEYSQFAEQQSRVRTPISGARGVWLGDSLSEGRQAVGTTVPDVVARALGVTIVNGGMGGTVFSTHANEHYRKLGGAALAYALATGEWDEVEAAVRAILARGDNNVPILARLMAVDLNQTDFVVLAYGTNDFGFGLPIGDADDETRATVRGAINEAISVLQTRYPHLRIFVITPVWRSSLPGWKPGQDADNAPGPNGLYLSDYVDAMLDQAARNHVPAWDGYRLGRFNRYNQAEYLTDGVHPSPVKGEGLLGTSIASFLLANY